MQNNLNFIVYLFSNIVNYESSVVNRIVSSLECCGASVGFPKVGALSVQVPSRTVQDLEVCRWELVPLV